MCSTIVNVAVPDLMRISASARNARNGSRRLTAAMTLSMLPTPWLLARYGYRHTYVGAVLLLMGAASSAWTALAAGAGHARRRAGGRRCR